MSDQDQDRFKLDQGRPAHDDDSDDVEAHKLDAGRP